ncbi:MAG: hypothetical protein IT289_12365 [Oligoflexia bacterium]|nr:hypothetical protein [Oligoflexia bacterium]
MIKWARSLKPLLIFLLPSILAGVLLGAYPGYKIYEFVWKDAGFCISCHVHDYANVGWADSVHGTTTTCHDCHHQPLRAYIKEAFIMVVKQPKFPKDLHHTPYVPQNLCAACHLTNPHDRSTITGPMTAGEVDKIPKVDQSYLHDFHLKKKTDFKLLNNFELSEGERNANPEAAKVLSQEKGPERPIVCADCHGGPSNRGHNFGAVDTSCIRCHQPTQHTRMIKNFGCRTCHFQDFLTPIPHKRAQ